MEELHNVRKHAEMLSPHWLFSPLQWFFLARSPRRKSWTLRAKWLMVSAGWSAQPSTSTQCSEVRQPASHAARATLPSGGDVRNIFTFKRDYVLSCEPLVSTFNDKLTPAFTSSYYWWSGVERREVFPARCPVANTCQALPGGDLWLHKASVTLAAIHPTATKFSAGLPVSLRGRSESEEKPRPPPAVIVFLWKSYWLTTICSTYKFHVVNLMFLMLLLMGVVVVVVFLHTTKEKRTSTIL